jgi:hypothetical protein
MPVQSAPDTAMHSPGILSLALTPLIRIILHGKELEDSSRLSDCGLVVGLDEEAPTVHLVMRLPAPGTARRKRDPVLAQKDGTGGVCTPKVQGLKVKTEPIEDDDLKAMSLVGQLSDMLVDGDQMEFEQVTACFDSCCCAPLLVWITFPFLCFLALSCVSGI